MVDLVEAMCGEDGRGKLIVVTFSDCMGNGSSSSLYRVEQQGEECCSKTENNLTAIGSKPQKA